MFSGSCGFPSAVVFQRLWFSSGCGSIGCGFPAAEELFHRLWFSVGCGFPPGCEFPAAVELFQRVVVFRRLWFSIGCDFSGCGFPAAVVFRRLWFSGGCDFPATLVVFRLLWFSGSWLLWLSSDYRSNGEIAVLCCTCVPGVPDTRSGRPCIWTQYGQ